MIYIQCFYQYPVTFSSIGKTFPAAKAVGEMRNLAEVSDKEYDKLMSAEPFFRELINNKKYRVLKKMPEGYKPSAQRINEAQDEIARLKAENERLRAQQNTPEVTEEEVIEAPAESEVIDFDKADYKELQKYAKDLGIEPNQKKSVLIAELKKAALEAAKENK